MVGNGGCGKKIWVRLHHGGRTTGENCSRNEVGNAPFPAAALKSREGWLEVYKIMQYLEIYQRENKLNNIPIVSLVEAIFIYTLTAMFNFYGFGQVVPAKGGSWMEMVHSPQVNAGISKD
ncbi:hypothetical protein LWI29_030972 [Acer saccharum]|uniref:Uncharacterized protein n=1 Tax=Acer saccharum TaxID=4024 RepID=A0AA39T7G7_ACESA|nr:hypothetical protein LWI29_030972 [Acer saccharum]